MREKKKSLFDQEKAKGKFTIIFDKVLRSALKAGLTLNELRVFLFIAQETWGWKKDSAIIRVRDIAKELKIDKKNASRILSDLKKQQVVGIVPTNRYQIQMDTSKWRIKTKYEGQRKRGKNQNVGIVPTKRKKNVGIVPTSKPEDTSNNQHLQSPRDKIFKREIRNTILKDIHKKKKGLSLSREKPFFSQKQNLADQEELQNFGIIYLTKNFKRAGGWEWRTQEKKEKIIIKLIPRLKAQTKVALALCLKEYKKHVDNKPFVHNKVGYLWILVKEGVEIKNNKKIPTPPCLEGLE